MSYIIDGEEMRCPECGNRNLSHIVDYTEDGEPANVCFNCTGCGGDFSDIKASEYLHRYGLET